MFVRFKGKREDEKILPVEEYVTMLKSAKADYERDFVLLWLTGMVGGRLQEMVELSTADVDLKNCFLRRRLEKKDEALGTEYRATALSSRLIEPIRAYVQRCKGYLFPGERGGHIHWRTGQEIFHRHHPECGLGHSFHSLRHLHGSLAFEAVWDLLYAKWRLGHQAETVTEQYVIWAWKRRDSEVVQEKLEPLLEKYGILSVVVGTRPK